MDEKIIIIDPRDFINPPFWTCPKCNSPKAFGVLAIGDQYYVRRCRNCRYEVFYSLPKLNKKIIYIDQFAISNMMKALNPKTKAYRRGTIDDFWIKMFESLNTLCKLQVVVCPASFYHTNESLLSPYYEPLKQMYELLSCGVSFYDSETIRRFQIISFLKNWISGNNETHIDLNVNSVLNGKIDSWQERFIISVSFPENEEWIETLRKYREATHIELAKLSRYWQSCKNKDYWDFFEDEIASFGKTCLKIYCNYCKKLMDLGDSLIVDTDTNIEKLLLPPAVILINDIKSCLLEFGIEKSKVFEKTIEFLTSPDLRYVPFIRISAMLYAALARKFASGRKKPPNQGMVNDIGMISTLLPYCNAMFIDNECYGYLMEQPLYDQIKVYNTKLFSLNTKEEFLEYLNEIKLNISQAHLNKVREVYGDDWLKPYTTLYK